MYNTTQARLLEFQAATLEEFAALLDDYELDGKTPAVGTVVPMAAVK